MQNNVSIGNLTTFGVGGIARRYVAVNQADDLVEAVKLAKEKRWKYFVLAGGSNVVFPEKYSGFVIHYRSDKPEINGLTVQAGTSLMDFIDYTIERGFVGLETLSGIPGTVGGAIVGNAGAYGQTISDNLVRVKIFNGKKVVWLTRQECKFTYRESIFKKKGKQDWLVLEAEFDLKLGNKAELKRRSQEIIAVRNERYIPGLKCPGSFFKNVPADKVSKKVLKLINPEKIKGGKIPTGYLLEEIGAKGLKFGNLEIAAFHGNLIINNGGATMKEVKKLSNFLKTRVLKKFGIKLEEEVRYVG